MQPSDLDQLGTLRPSGLRGGRSEPKARPRIAAWTVRALRLIGKLSLRRIQQIGGGIGRLVAWLPTRPKKNTFESLRIAYPELNARQLRGLARESLIHDGKMMIEHAAFWTWDRERVLACIEIVEGEKWLQEAMASGQGVILAATHLGAVEALNIYCSVHHAMSSQYREPRIRELDTFFRDARERFGSRLMPASKASVRLLLKGLRNGDLLGIPCDQDAGQGQGIFVPFFGTLANTMTLISRLANKSGAKVVVGFSERLPDGAGFKVHLVPAPDDFYSDDLVTSASALNRTVEECVRRFPAQYLWSYRRFRIRPPAGASPAAPGPASATTRTAHPTTTAEKTESESTVEKVSTSKSKPISDGTNEESEDGAELPSDRGEGR